MFVRSKDSSCLPRVYLYIEQVDCDVAAAVLAYTDALLAGGFSTVGTSTVPFPLNVFAEKSGIFYTACVA